MKYQVNISGLDSKGSLTLQSKEKYQVVVSGLDSNGLLILQNNIKYPVVVPSMNSYGTTIVDGLISTYSIGAQWVATLDAHVEGSMAKRYANGAASMEIDNSASSNQKINIVCVDGTVGVLDAIANACAIIQANANNELVIDSEAYSGIVTYSNIHSSMLIETSVADAKVSKYASGSSEMELEETTLPFIKVKVEPDETIVGLMQETAKSSMLVKADGAQLETITDVVGKAMSAVNVSSDDIGLEIINDIDKSIIRAFEEVQSATILSANMSSAGMLLEINLREKDSTSLDFNILANGREVVSASSDGDVMEILSVATSTMLRFLYKLYDHDDKDLRDIAGDSLVELSYAVIE